MTLLSPLPPPHAASSPCGRSCSTKATGANLPFSDESFDLNSEGPEALGKVNSPNFSSHYPHSHQQKERKRERERARERYYDNDRDIREEQKHI